MKALKFLDEGAVGPYSRFSWPVPNGKPGRWVKADGDLEACRNGIHACTPDQALSWLQNECYVIELGGRVFEDKDKIVARKGRLLYKTALDERALRLFAADCAEHVLHLFEAVRPDDDRPRKAIETARAFANGKAAIQERDAAGAAARAAARDAAWAAAGAAAAAAGAAARAAAGDAAGALAAAAGAAARAAARAAAGNAERRWQLKRLKHYLKLPKGWDA